MVLSPQELREKVCGLEAFTCTPFSADNEIDPGRFRGHLNYLTSGPWPKPAGCFVCCGTGEFWSLDLVEYKALVTAAAQEIGGKVPVVAGAGYGTRMAIAFARTAEEWLLLPSDPMNVGPGFTGRFVLNKEIEIFKCLVES